MADPTLSVTISRTGDDLTFDASGTFELIKWFPPALEWRKQVVAGRYQPGERLVNAVPDTAVIGGLVRVTGADWDDVDDAINEMYVALQQFDYTVTTTTNSVAEVFTDCQPATIRPLNGERASGEVRSGFAEFEIQIRCTPNIGSEA